MRWLRYRHGGRVAYGAVEGDEVLEHYGDPFTEAGPTGVRLALDAVEMLVPVVPPTFYAAGLNYAAHVTEAAELVGTPVNLPEAADVGYRANNALVPHGAEIIIPADATDKVQYEGELVAVIGRRCHKADEAEALDYVLGYTIGNDVSERTWQKTDRTLWRAKNTETFAPMGPWIETDVDLDALTTTVRINGETACRFATNDMIFGVAHFISRMSRYLVLHPGDVVWMGADGPTLDIKAGDVVEVEIDGIGVLRNPVVRAA